MLNDNLLKTVQNVVNDQIALCAGDLESLQFFIDSRKEAINLLTNKNGKSAMMKKEGIRLIQKEIDSIK